MLDFLSYRFNLLTLSLSIIVGIILVFQVLHYIIVYGRVIFYEKKKNKNSLAPQTPYEQGVSIVLIANNNGAALQEQLLMLLEQDYPLFEIVIVNENSQDDTEYILYVLQNTYSNIKVVNFPKNINHFSHRKYSLALGIRSATYDNIVLTDVVCQVKDFDWLKSLMQPFLDNKKKMIFGFCGVMPGKGLLNQFVQYHQLTRAMDTYGMAILGMPYRADGKNICYNKNFFFDKNGLILQYRDNCKQEDYFVNRYAKKSNSVVNLDPKSFTYRPKFERYRDFKRVCFADYYSTRIFRFWDKFRLMLMPLSTFFFYLILTFLVILGFPWQYILVPIVIKWIIQIIYHNKCSKKLDIKTLYGLAPLMEIYFMFFNFNLRVKHLFTRKKKHKIKWT